MKHRKIKVKTRGNALTKTRFLYNIESIESDVYLNLEESDIYTSRMWKLVIYIIFTGVAMVSFKYSDKDTKTRHLRVKLCGKISDIIEVSVNKDKSINLIGVDSFTIISDHQEQSPLRKRRLKLVNWLVGISALLYLTLIVIVIVEII